MNGIDNYINYYFYDTWNHWSKNNSKWVYDKGHMSGTSTYGFSPDAVTNRAMAVTTLYNMVGKPSASLSRFSDVPSSAYYAKAVGWASAKGVSGGIGNNQFGPNNNIIRQDLILMLYKVASLQSKNTTASGNLNNFNQGRPWRRFPRF